MRLKKICYEEVKCTVDGVKYDMDQYMVEMRSPMATHEYNITIDHISKEVSGDVIRYGSWDDLDQDEIKEILQQIEWTEEIARPYDGYTIRGA